MGKDADELRRLAKDAKTRLARAAKSQARLEAAALLEEKAKEQRRRAGQEGGRGAAAGARAGAGGPHGFDPSLLWWTRPDRSSTRRGARDRAEVMAELVEAATRIADEEGLDALSMRRLAQAVGMGTMSLYWYVEGKDDLFDVVMDHLIGQTLVGPEALGDWRAGLAAIARSTRDMLLAHPWTVQVLGHRPMLGPNLLRHIDECMAAVDALDVPDPVKMQILRAVDDFTYGHAARAVADAEVAKQVGVSEMAWYEQVRPHIEAQVEEHELVHLARYLADHALDEDQGDEFEAGLEIVLAGVDALVARHRA